MMVDDRLASVQAVWPLLAVDDLPATLTFWRDRLGFDVVGQAESEGRLFWCRLQRHGASIMLQAADAEEDGPARERGRGVSLYFVCDDVDALYRELVGKGVSLEPPDVAYYGMKQLVVPEPHGYFVCFESPASSGG